MTKAPKELDNPNVRLSGEVGPDMLDRFFEQVDRAKPDAPLVIELTTEGGNAEIGRRLALEIRLLAEQGRALLFLGKTVVYSAGVTLMAAVPVAGRWLTRDTLLLVHGRKLIKTIELAGNLRAAEQQAQALLAEAQTGIVAEDEGFAELAQGSKLSEAKIRELALSDWYLTAAEALEHGLVQGFYGPRPPRPTGGPAAGSKGTGGVRRGR